ncbi:MAG: hypothetical protein QHI38_00440 [Armatimonadota bacterium]|nr:hypothetical protein [Armatimonadota bacterium]
MSRRLVGLAALFLLAVVPNVGISATTAGWQVVDAYYRFDVPYPKEFTEYLKDMSPREWALDLRQWEKPLAGSTHVYLKNTGTEPLLIEDVEFAGISLKRAIAFSDQDVKREADPASIFFSDLSAAERKKLIAAGDPIWWRARPSRVPPGEVCEITVRLRTNPPSGTVRLTVCTKGQKPLEVSIPMRHRPRFEYISFSRDLKEMTAFCSAGSKPPQRILLDGEDITSNCTIRFDPDLKVSPVVAKLTTPLKRGKYCCVQAVYPDGSKATELVKVWSDEPAYGMWGAMPGDASDKETAKRYFADLAAHNINTQMEQIGSDCVIEFLKTQEGREYLASLGIRRTVNDYLKQGTTNPYLYFLADEPESADFYVKGVPPEYKMGCLTQGMVNKAQSLHEKDPVTPCAVNINYTFRPQSTYAYGEIPDILMCDPYYQARLSHAYDRSPRRVPLYANARCIYALTYLPRLACMPRPLHMVLYAVSAQSGKGEVKFRFPTPEEKRTEVYYALAGGAKQLSFWWYTPTPPGKKGANGCGAEQPAAKALWKQIGLLGAEFGTVSELVAASCPVDLKTTVETVVGGCKELEPSLWTKTLLSGTDTLLLICVNENLVCDRLGTVYAPIERADLKVDIPDWLLPKDVFEVTYKGIANVNWNKQKALNISLEDTDLTRLIVVTADPQLRSKLVARYNEKYAEKVAKLAELE